MKAVDLRRLDLFTKREWSVSGIQKVESGRSLAPHKWVQYSIVTLGMETTSTIFGSLFVFVEVEN